MPQVPTLGPRAHSAPERPFARTELHRNSTHVEIRRPTLGSRHLRRSPGVGRGLLVQGRARVRPRVVVSAQGLLPGPGHEAGRISQQRARPGRTGTRGVPASPSHHHSPLPESSSGQRQQKRQEHQRGAHRVLGAGAEQVAAGLAKGPGGGSVRAPLREAWRWLRRPGGGPSVLSRAPGGPPRGRCGRAGRRRREPGGRGAAGGRVAGGVCAAAARPAAVATPVPSAPAPAPPLPFPRSARAGRRWAGEQ